MPYLNQLNIIGNLGGDPQMRYTPSGAAVTNFTVALNRPNKDGQRKEETIWLRAVLWNERAEKAVDVLKKGDLVFLSGSFSPRKYLADGVEKLSLEIEVLNWQKLRESTGGGDTAPALATAGSARPARAATQRNAFDDLDDFDF